MSGLISVRARPHESPCVLGPLLVETRTCRGYEECRALSCTMRNAEIDNEASGRKGCRSSMLEGGNFLAHCALGWVRKRMSQLNLISFIWSLIIAHPPSSLLVYPRSLSSDAQFVSGRRSCGFKVFMNPVRIKKNVPNASNKVQLRYTINLNTDKTWNEWLYPIHDVLS